MNDLCQIAVKYGSDRTPEIYHGYTPYYHELFKDRRNDVKKVLEIGIDRGWGLFMWREYFPNAEIVALEADPVKLVNVQRIRSRRCDQGSGKDLLDSAIWAGSGFDFIVDDGSHHPTHQVASALVMIPLLGPGGIYIIEDVGHPDFVTANIPYKSEVVEFHINKTEFDDDRLVVFRA